MGLHTEENRNLMSEKLIQKWRDDKILWMLLAGALLLRVIGFVIYVAQGGTGVEPDTESYLFSAVLMKTNFQFGETAFRTPGYPFILMITMFLFGENYYYGLVPIQILLNVVAIYFVYKCCVLLTQKKQVGYVATAIASLNFLDISYCYKILTDSIAQTCTIISIYFFLVYLKSLKNGEKENKSILLASVFLVFAVFIRPASVYLPLALMAGLVFAAIVYKRYKSILLIILSITLIVNTPVMLWSKRNEKVVGFDGFSTVSSVNLYTYNAAAVHAKQRGVSYYDALVELQSEEDPILQDYMKTMSKYDAYSRRGLEIITSDFSYYLLSCLKDCVYLTGYPGAMTFDFVSEGVSDLVAQVKGSSELSLADNLQNPASIWSLLILGMDLMILVAISIFSIAGWLKLWRKDWLQAALLLGILAYNYVATCQPMGIGTFSRFRLSFSMITCICAAYGLYALFHKVRERKRRREV